MSSPSIQLTRDDTSLDALLGQFISSPTEWGTTYQFVQRLGAGGMSVAMLALRNSTRGVGPVVIKLLTPEYTKAAGRAADLSLRKEISSLQRLNERVPPTPYVVRLLDIGSLDVSYDGEPLSLGWIGLEYVHGGAEGATLAQRVGYSLLRTNAGFDPVRAAEAIRCIAAGLSAVHAVGVLHRDLKPSNVLCCGFGTHEIFKLADFGIARSGAIQDTFRSAGVGTPGYSAPEQLYSQGAELGPSSDVFGFAAIVYFLLTGQHMFSFQSLKEMAEVMGRPDRPKLHDAPNVSPSIKGASGVCERLDDILARATRYKPTERPKTADALAQELLAPLLSPARLGSTTQNRLPKATEAPAPDDAAWVWLEREHSWPTGLVVSAGFDADGACLAASTRGLAFWDGNRWRPALPAMPLGADYDAVLREGPGRWLVSSGPILYRYSGTGLERLEDIRSALHHNVTDIRINRLSGSPSEVLCLVSEQTGADPMLWRVTSKGFLLEPRPLDGVACINGITRAGPTDWLLAGRTSDGRGYLARYRPLKDKVELIDTPPVSAFTRVAADPERGLGLVVGTHGTTLVYEGGHFHPTQLPEAAHLSACTVDATGGFWAGGNGRIWHRSAHPGASWAQVWQAEHDPEPITAMYSDSGVLFALGARGRMLEGFATRITPR